MNAETRPLELLYLLPAAGFGGAERQGVYHLAELPRHDVTVTAFVGPGDSIMNELREAKLDHERFEYFPDRDHGPLTSFENLMHPPRSAALVWRSASEIEQRVRGKRFDLIFANRTFAWLVAALLSRRLAVPYVLRAGSRLAHPALAVGLRALGHVSPPLAAFCNCQAVERDIATRLRCQSYALPNAVDADRFRPGSAGQEELARSQLGLPQGVPVVGLAARPAPEKGFDFFEKVVARVRSAEPAARFVVAGDFGWRDRYEANLRRAGLGNAVRFLGRVGAIQDFLRAVDIVILTSRARSIEASPNALLEAMSAARPIVATSVGGVPELVRHGREGYLSRDDDDAGFAAHLIELIGNPNRRRWMGRAGRSHVLSRHQVRAVVTELAENLRSIAPSFAARTALATGT